MSALKQFDPSTVQAREGLVLGDLALYSIAEVEALEKDFAASVAIAESGRNAALKSERQDCERALGALSAVGIPTPLEGFWCNSSWAVADLCRGIAEVAKQAASAAEDTARLDIIANNAGTVISELLNGNDEEDEFPEGFRVEMVLNGKAYTAEAVDLRDALDKLRADAAIDAARKESR